MNKRTSVFEMRNSRVDAAHLFTRKSFDCCFPELESPIELYWKDKLKRAFNADVPPEILQELRATYFDALAVIDTLDTRLGYVTNILPEEKREEIRQRFGIQEDHPSDTSTNFCRYAANQVRKLVSRLRAVTKR